jgi:hypothetical protein
MPLSISLFLVFLLPFLGPLVLSLPLVGSLLLLRALALVVAVAALRLPLRLAVWF